MSDTLKCFLFLLGIVIVSGCSTPPVTITVPEPEKPAAPEPEVIAVPDPRIRQLLDEAEQAFARNYLTTPIEDNAYLRYMQVLSLDPGNDAAEHGIANIVERYLDWAIVNSRNGNSRKALDYLNKAKSVDETHPGIPAVVSLINNMQATQQVSFQLNLPDLNARNSAILTLLKQIADEIQRLQATIMIKTPGDKQARWIYQQINQITDTRLRAQFEYHPAPQIILRYK